MPESDKQPQPKVYWEHVIDLSGFVNNGEFTNLQFNQPEKPNIDSIVIDLQRSSAIDVKGNTNDDDRPDSNNWMFALQKLELNENIINFIFNFCYQKGFSAIGRASIVENPLIHKEIYISARYQDVRDNFLFEKNEDGSIDFTQNSNFVAFRSKIDGSVFQKNDRSAILKVSTKFNISFTEDKGLTFKVKESRLTAYSELADRLYPNREPNSAAICAFNFYVMDFLVNKLFKEKHNSKMINGYLAEFLVKNPNSDRINSLNFSEHSDHFFDLLRAHEKYCISDPRKGRPLTTNEYLIELLEISKVLSRETQRNTNIIDYIQEIEAKNPDICAELASYCFKILEAQEKYCVIDLVKDRPLRKSEYLAELYLIHCNYISESQSNKNMDSISKFQFNLKNLKFITEKISIAKRDSHVLSYVENIISQTSILNEDTVEYKQCSKLLKVYERYCITDSVIKRRLSTQEYLSELRAIHAEFKPGIFENLLGKLNIKQTRNYQLSQALKNTINSIEQTRKEARLKRQIVLEENLKNLEREPAISLSSKTKNITDMNNILYKLGSIALKLGQFERAKAVYQRLNVRPDIANGIAAEEKLTQIKKQHEQLLKLKQVKKNNVGEQAHAANPKLQQEINKLNVLISATKKIEITSEMYLVIKNDQNAIKIFSEISNITDEEYLKAMQDIFLESQNKLKKASQDIEVKVIEAQLIELQDQYCELLRISELNKEVAPSNHLNFFQNYHKANVKHHIESTLADELFGHSDSRELESQATVPVKKSYPS